MALSLMKELFQRQQAEGERVMVMLAVLVVLVVLVVLEVQEVQEVQEVHFLMPRPPTGQLPEPARLGL